MRYSGRLEAFSYPWNLMKLLKEEETAFHLPSWHKADDLRYSKILMNPWNTSFTRMIQLGCGSRCTDSWQTPHIPKFRNTEGGMRKSFQSLIDFSQAKENVFGNNFVRQQFNLNFLGEVGWKFNNVIARLNLITFPRGWFGLIIWLSRRTDNNFYILNRT